MKSKNFLYYLVLFFGVLLLLVRLFELQVILGEKNLDLAEGNRIRKEIIPAPRGIIYDREGRALVRNVPVYWLDKKSGDQKEATVEPVTRERALKIKAGAETPPGELKTGVGREYLYGQALAHVLGYLDWEMKGGTGLEFQYNDHLQGQDGGEIIEVDTSGVKLREVDRLEPVAGSDLFLSLDAELSKTAFEALDGRPGAVVATQAKTGRVLVLVSSPSFDPGLFNLPKVPYLFHLEGGIGTAPWETRNTEVAALFDNSQKPLFNRVIGGVYPPGSTFKIVSAAAGLEEEKIDGQTLIEDTGVIKIGPYSYSNWYFTRYGRTEGEINVVRAIQRSTDTFFYKVGEMVGAESLATWAGSFGLGKLTGIDLGGEVDGLVPTPDWKQAVMGERWFLGNTYHFAIGQADLLATPLQVNMMTSVIANGGRLCRPSLAGLESESRCQDLQLKQATLELIKEGLVGVCSPGGTAGVFFNFEPRVACKTGTAEFGSVKASGYRDTHAWLTAFAPADDPEIVVTALVEGGGEGSDVAAPIVKKVMEEWFKSN